MKKALLVVAAGMISTLSSAHAANLYQCWGSEGSARSGTNFAVTVDEARSSLKITRTEPPQITVTPEVTDLEFNKMTSSQTSETRWEANGIDQVSGLRAQVALYESLGADGSKMYQLKFQTYQANGIVVKTMEYGNWPMHCTIAAE